MKPCLTIAFLTAAVLISAAFQRPALAFTPGACRQDEQKFCGDVKPGDGAIRDCMKQHEADFSPACKDNIAEGKQKMQDKMKEIQEACKQDLQQFCAKVTPGEGREIACLRSYNDKISAGCKEKMPKLMMHKGMRHHDKGGANQDKNDADDQDGTPPPPPPAGK